MTEQERLERRIRLAKWEGLKINGEYKGIPTHEMPFFDTTHSPWIPDYDTDAAALLRLMEKAITNDLTLSCWNDPNFKIIVETYDWISGKEKKGHADSLTEAILQAIDAAIQGSQEVDK